MTSRIPTASILHSNRSNIVLPAIGNRHLGWWAVCGQSRRPRPAANIIAFNLRNDLSGGGFQNGRADIKTASFEAGSLTGRHADNLYTSTKLTTQPKLLNKWRQVNKIASIRRSLMWVEFCWNAVVSIYGLKRHGMKLQLKSTVSLPRIGKVSC